MPTPEPEPEEEPSKFDEIVPQDDWGFLSKASSKKKKKGKFALVAEGSG